MNKEKSELKYTNYSEELNIKISELMNDFKEFVSRAKTMGLDVRLHPDSETLELYFNDDYPDTLLVDKYFSEKKRRNK